MVPQDAPAGRRPARNRWHRSPRPDHPAPCFARRPCRHTRGHAVHRFGTFIGLLRECHGAVPADVAGF